MMQATISLKHVSESIRIFRTGWVLLLAVALLGTESVPAFAQGAQTSDASTVESQVKKFGVGKSVKVTLANGEQIKEHIWAISADSFTVKVSKRSTARSIPFAQVTEVKDPGFLVWELICAAVAVVIVVIIRA